MVGTETWPGPAQAVIMFITCVVQPLDHVMVGKWAGMGHWEHCEVWRVGIVFY